MKGSTGTDASQVLTLTRQLLELVREEDWEAAAKIEAERFRLLRQDIAGTSLTSVMDRIAQLKEMAELDREIFALGREKQEILGRRLSELRQGRKAGKAYGQGFK